VSWLEPIHVSENEQLHYNRFIYRVIRFGQLFDWFEIAETNKPRVIDFESNLNDLIINTPINKASQTSENSSFEKQIEYDIKNLDLIREEFQFQCVNHQLPVGVRKGKNGVFTGRGSAIDIWGIDHHNKLNIFELKYESPLITPIFQKVEKCIILGFYTLLFWLQVQTQ
jgi:hypothetical protein